MDLTPLCLPPGSPLSRGPRGGAGGGVYTKAMPIHAMITEDDFISRTILAGLLEDFYPDVRIVCMAPTVKESLEFLRDHKIDLLFLDIELPDGKGFDILRSIHNVDFIVIITTSYPKYQEEAGSFHNLYTIIKPLTRQNLEKAMQCFRKEETYLN